MSSRWSKNSKISNSISAIDTAENKDNLFKNDICTQFCRELHKKLLDRFDFLESIDDDMYAIGSKLMGTRNYYINFKKNNFFDGIDFRWMGKTGDSRNTFIICLRLALNETIKTKFIKYTKSLKSREYYIVETHNSIKLCANFNNFPYENFTNMDSHAKFVSEIDKLYNYTVNLLQNFTTIVASDVSAEPKSSSEKSVKDEEVKTVDSRNKTSASLERRRDYGKVNAKEKGNEIQKLIDAIHHNSILGDKLFISDKYDPKTASKEIILRTQTNLLNKIGLLKFVIGFTYNEKSSFFYIGYDRNSDVEKLCYQIRNLKLFDHDEIENNKFYEIVSDEYFILYARELKNDMSFTEKVYYVTFYSDKFMKTINSMLSSITLNNDTTKSNLQNTSQAKLPSNLKFDPKKAIGDDTIICCLCGVELKLISSAHLRQHGTTPENYRTLCGYESTQPLMANNFYKEKQEIVAKAQKARKKLLGKKRSAS